VQAPLFEFYAMNVALLFFYFYIFLGLLLEQGCPCLGFPVGTFIALLVFTVRISLLALYVYVPVCILVIFFVSQINWIGLD